ncbi:MAG TPA: FHA domain-containing protein [Kouleothrix sp.]|uniref:FHA domain-containing protein n=1 Tax=Kouleothrix sp. TaxID=2779161 RepID=UPI002CC71383|nr:FHA domain-containing protein [Kouleothrix sp.]HRC76570.1 FHA domain-containing protein [Kouleothrix sp.]
MARATPGILTYRRAEGGEERIKLRQDVTTLGRSDSCAVVIALPVISRLHARIELQHDRYVLFDAGSANGTFVNGKRLEQGAQLSTGDEIWLGSQDVALQFSDPEETLVMQPNVLPPALFIDEDARTVQVYGVPMQLSPLEYGLLLHLAHNPGTVCTREGTFLAVWGQPYNHATCEDALNACIAKLRRNLRNAAESVGREPPPITTVQRVGFRLDAEVTFAPGAGRSAASYSGT